MIGSWKSNMLNLWDPPFPPTVWFLKNLKNLRLFQTWLQSQSVQENGNSIQKVKHAQRHWEAPTHAPRGLHCEFGVVIVWGWKGEDVMDILRRRLGDDRWYFSLKWLELRGGGRMRVPWTLQIHPTIPSLPNKTSRMFLLRLYFLD